MTFLMKNLTILTILVTITTFLTFLLTFIIIVAFDILTILVAPDYQGKNHTILVFILTILVTFLETILSNLVTILLNFLTIMVKIWTILVTNIPVDGHNISVYYPFHPGEYSCNLGDNPDYPVDYLDYPFGYPDNQGGISRLF